MTLADAVRGKRVAVVCPSVDPGGGAEIDSRDVVIRVNRGHPVPAELQPDLGSRTDILYHYRYADEARRKRLVADTEGAVVVFSPLSGVDWSRPSGLMEYPGWGKTPEGACYPHCGTVCVADCLESGAAQVHVAGMTFYAGADPVMDFHARGFGLPGERHDARVDARWMREAAVERGLSMDSATRRAVGGLSFGEILGKLRAEEPFSFVRFGDGEFRCMIGWPGANCDGHRYFPDLGEALAGLLSDPGEIYLGVQAFSKMRRYGMGDGDIDASRKLVGDARYGSAWLFHRALEGGRLGELFDALRGRHTVVVGPSRMEKLAPWLSPSAHVRIPERDCWTASGEVAEKLGAILPLYERPVALFCAGLAAKPWISRFHGSGRTLIDIGAALDPLTGRLAREYQRRGRWKSPERIYGDEG
jgi:hypothetical protein